jgi:hypothetical protein
MEGLGNWDIAKRERTLRQRRAKTGRDEYGAADEGTAAGARLVLDE